jgi:hypothetical protein
MDKEFALLRSHRNNIGRYRNLLKTNLTDLERQFIERRLAEEQVALEKVMASTFPITFRMAPAGNPELGNQVRLEQPRSARGTLGAERVPKTSVFGTAIFGETKQRRCWVSEPSFSEGFRDRLPVTPT